MEADSELNDKNTLINLIDTTSDWGENDGTFSDLQFLADLVVSPGAVPSQAPSPRAMNHEYPILQTDGRENVPR